MWMELVAAEFVLSLTFVWRERENHKKKPIEDVSGPRFEPVDSETSQKPCFLR